MAMIEELVRMTILKVYGSQVARFLNRTPTFD